jgi:tetratricopeptide (TPR) repeat protein
LFDVGMAKNYRLALKIDSRNKEARQAEHDDDPGEAIKLYEQNVKEDYADDFAFERLMILYRKQKRYKDELRIVNRAIDVFEESLKTHLHDSLARHTHGKKLEQISKAIIKKSGLQKEEFHFPDPIDKWMKRKAIVEKKLEE